MIEMLPPPAAVVSTPPPAPPPAGPDEPRRLPRWRQAVVVLAIPLFLLVWVAVSVGLFLLTRGEPAPSAPLAHGGPPNGGKLYALHCASCHGATGEADGPNSSVLAPKARRFGYDKFRLGSTTNGVPTDADLAGVIRRGIPGSAMPGFDQLTGDEVAALAGHVRTLARAGTYKRLYEKAAESGDADPTELLEIADRQSTPGDPLPIPETFVSTADAIAHGRQVYTTVCASCHGPDGKGDGPQVKDLKNEDGSPTRPRDLTSGVFKGGGDPAHVYSRIMLGMPGTPMPASSQLPQQDITGVLSYVLSLSKTGQP